MKEARREIQEVTEHNNRTGNDRKECEFRGEMTEFFGSNPKIVPAATVSSMAKESGTADHSDDEDEELPRNTPPKKKKRRSSKFLKEFKDDKRKEELEKMSLSQKNAPRENVCNESIPRHFVKKGRLRTYYCIYVHFLKHKLGDCFGFKKKTHAARIFQE